MSDRHMMRPEKREQRRAITKHALERIRQRTDSLEFAAFEDVDLRRLLDDAVEDAIVSGKSEILYDPQRGEDFLLVDVSERFSGMHAVVGKNMRDGYQAQAVITLTQVEWREQNLRNGMWQLSGKPQDAEAVRHLERSKPVVHVEPASPPTSPFLIEMQRKIDARRSEIRDQLAQMETTKKSLEGELEELERVRIG